MIYYWQMEARTGYLFMIQIATPNINNPIILLRFRIFPHIMYLIYTLSTTFSKLFNLTSMNAIRSFPQYLLGMSDIL